MSAQLAYVHSPIARPTARPSPQVEGRERVYRGSFEEVRALLPDFEREAFTLGSRTIANRFLDTIVRRSDPLQGLPAVPVGVVSRHYAMVTHREVLDAVRKVVVDAGLDPAGTALESVVGEYGGKMALSVVLPSEFALDPGDGHALALRLFCVNSVDRSSRFRIAVGWYRFVCGNGLMVGKTCTEIRESHREGLSLNAVRDVLAHGLGRAKSESNALRGWVATPVDERALAAFVDKPLAAAWGVKAAARLWHIARTGRDATFASIGEDTLPHARRMKALAPVPDSPERARTAYDVSQGLAWLAKCPRDPADRLDRMAEIPQLMSALVGKRTAPPGATP